MSDDEELVDYENLNPPVGRLIKLLNLNNEEDEGWTSDEEEQENSINSTSDVTQAFNPNINGINSQAVGNSPSFSNAGIGPSRFAGPAINSGFVGQVRNSWNNRFPVNTLGSEAVQPSASTPFAAAASRFMGPREFRGPRTGIGTTRPPVFNPTVGVNRMPFVESNRPPFNIRHARAQLLNRPIAPSLSPVDNHSHRSPIDTKPVDELNQNYFSKPSSRPPFPISSRPLRPNLFPRTPLNSGMNRFPTPDSIGPFGRGNGMNLNPYAIRGARTPSAARDDITKLEPKNAASLPKLPSIVSNSPSKEEEGNEEYESEGEYEQQEDEYDVDQEILPPNEPPPLPPPRPLHSGFLVAGKKPAPMINNAFRYPKNAEAGNHSKENIRPTVSELKNRVSATDEVDDHNTLPSISSRTPSTSFQPYTPSWSSPQSSDITNHGSSTTSPETPLPPPRMPKFPQSINIRPPAITQGGRKISHEGVPSSNTVDDTRGIRTITDLEGYEQIPGGDVSSSSLNNPRTPAGPRATRPSFPSPFMPMRPTQSTKLPSAQTMLLSLENGDSFESTPLYESILREDYFHLISQQEVPRRLAHDGMFLFQPSSSRNESNPLTLWLRYCGRNYKFSINRRDDGKFAIGKEKENEDRFYSIAEMASHYYQTPLKFEGRQMYFEGPAPKPM